MTATTRWSARLPAWDPTLPALGQLLARGAVTVTATRWRRYTVLPFYLNAIVLAAALIFPAEAHAAFVGTSPLLHELGIKDSYGVDIGNYAISTDYGTVLDGGSKAVLGTILDAEAGVFVVICGLAIWFLMYVLRFSFLKDLVAPIADVLQTYAAQIMPAVFAISAVISALIIAFNIMRGHTSRAVSQTLAALIVATVAGMFAYSPITWVVSDKGPLAQGRNLAVAAGSATSTGGANTAEVLNKLEGTYATAFIRHPLQNLNFSGQPDDTPACAAAWNAGVNSGDTDRIKDGIRDCGAADSHNWKKQADNPSAGQVGAGVVLMMIGGVVALFCFVLGFHVILEFLHALGAAASFLVSEATGVISGDPQDGFINHLVAMIFSGVAMFAYVTYAIICGQLITSTTSRQHNSTVALILCLIVMVAAIRYTFALSKKLKSSNRNTAASVRNSIGAGSGGGSGSSPSIPNERASNFLHAMGGAALGVGATVAGSKLQQHAPSASHALNIVAPALRSRTLSHVARGARMHSAQKTDEALDKLAAQANSTNPSQPPPSASTVVPNQQGQATAPMPTAPPAATPPAAPAPQSAPSTTSAPPPSQTPATQPFTAAPATTATAPPAGRTPQSTPAPAPQPPVPAHPQAPDTAARAPLTSGMSPLTDASTSPAPQQDSPQEHNGNGAAKGQPTPPPPPRPTPPAAPPPSPFAPPPPPSSRRGDTPPTTGQTRPMPPPPENQQ